MSDDARRPPVLRVRALKLGYYGDARRRVGDVFTLHDPRVFSATWMEPVDAETRAAVERQTNLSAQRAIAKRRTAVVQPRLTVKGWTRRKWAKQAGVAPSVVYGYLDGTSTPNDLSRQCLAESLGIPLDDLPL